MEVAEVHSVLFAIRGFYRDLAECPHYDPVPLGRGELAVYEQSIKYLRVR